MTKEEFGAMQWGNKSRTRFAGFLVLATAICGAGLVAAVSIAFAPMATASDSARAVAPKEPEASSPEEEQAPPVERRALLIGISEYPNLSPAEQLAGCTNDVAVMRSLLLDRFAYQADQIVTLTDSQATAQAIRAQITQLEQWASELPEEGPPAQLFFHFSGHGSQIDDQPEGDPDCDESDGRDETLVPYDATAQGGPTDIRDDEIYNFIDAVCSEGRVQLWIVLDSCHSGSGARGATRFRQLRRRGLTFLPPPEQAVRQITPKRIAEGAVILSACRDRELEPEYQVDGQSYGLLTRFLATVLTQQAELSAFTYGQLHQAIVVRYRGDQSLVQPPMPQLEGTPATMGGAILAAGPSLDRVPAWPVEAVSNDRGRARVAAGSLHGLTVGSVYELYSSPEEIRWETPEPNEVDGASASLGLLRIETVGGTEAEGTLFTQEGETVVGTHWPVGRDHGFAVRRYQAPGDFRLRLRVVQAIDAQTDGPALAADAPQVPELVRQAVHGMTREGEADWLTWTTGDETCDLVLRIDGNQAALFPASGRACLPVDPTADVSSLVPETLRGGWSLIDLGQAEESISLLQHSLRNIARVRNLIRVAARQQENLQKQNEEPQFNLSLELVKVEWDTQANRIVPESDTPWQADKQGTLVMQEGEIYALRVTNQDPLAGELYATLLRIDPNMGIHVALPYQLGQQISQEQRLAPEIPRLSDAYCCGDDYGVRYAVLLVSREPHSYAWLEQENLTTVRSGDQEPSLSELLQEQVYFRTRGGNDSSESHFDNSWTARVIQWTVAPDENTANEAASEARVESSKVE